jgi:dTDP-4-amino-4,6-dideoxygalactose transaminase
VRSVKFNIPFLTGNEKDYVNEVFASQEFSGNGAFTKRVQGMLEDILGAERVLLTHSCTGALEMAALLAGFGPGDEVLVPSYTFVTSASSIMRTGATPVFCEVDENTMLLDLNDLERKINAKTKGIVTVDYAGFGNDYARINEICEMHNLVCIEDAAQGLGAKWNGKSLGTHTRFGTISFHQTKNIHSGLGGCLVINNRDDVEKAEMVWERGTNRSAFFKGLVDKYNWQVVGSSFYPSELQAAFLCAQLEQVNENLSRRLELWNYYERLLKPMEERGILRILREPAGCEHNAHMFAIMLSNSKEADRLRLHLNENQIQAVIHYVPLHESPVGKELGYAPESLPVTSKTASSLIRLPLHLSMDEDDIEYIVKILQTLYLPLD